MDIERSPGFEQHFKQRANRRIKKLFRERSVLFQKNPHDPSLRTHALSYRWKGHWSFSLTDEKGQDDYRVIFRKERGSTLFVDFGTHDQLYRSSWPRADEKRK
jgi:mRNA-degrading endonuclease YafQ of YafQ-DinJ toxin-antitoxin module